MKVQSSIPTKLSPAEYGAASSTALNDDALCERQVLHLERGAFGVDELHVELPVNRNAAWPGTNAAEGRSDDRQMLARVINRQAYCRERSCRSR